MQRHTSSARRIGLAALPLVFLLAACDPPAAPPPAPSAKPAAPAVKDPHESAPPPLRPNQDAPEVTLKLQDGKEVKLSSLRGKQVLVYFYPKDDTPGCTVEAQGLRDGWAELQAAGLEVFGVSTQGAESHQAFIDKHKLPFPLVVDEDGAVARAFRVPIRNSFAARQSFLIGKDGKLKAVWLDVDPKEHASTVLAAAKS